MENKDLEDSLGHLKAYVQRTLERYLHNYEIPKESVLIIAEDIQHAIDHIITDHCQD